MTPAEYSVLALRTEADQEKVRQRIYAAGTQATQIENGARGLASDAGEVSACVQKWLEYGKPLDAVNLLTELGDCAWRMNQIMKAMGWTWEDVFKANIAKLAKRFPDGFSDFLAAEENRNREEEDKAAAATLNEVTQTPPEPRQQTGQGWAESPEENFWNRRPTIGDVIQAFQCGWQLNSELSEPAIYLPGDKSNNWAARWLKLTWRGQTISVPHWLSRRLHEIEEEKKVKATSSLQAFPSQSEDLPDEAVVRLGKYSYKVKLLNREEGHYCIIGDALNEVPVVTEPAASFGDGLVRPKELNSSYDRYCSVCNKNTIHRNNACGMCPNCMANKSATERETVLKGLEEKSAE